MIGGEALQGGGGVGHGGVKDGDGMVDTAILEASENVCRFG